MIRQPEFQASIPVHEDSEVLHNLAMASIIGNRQGNERFTGQTQGRANRGLEMRAIPACYVQRNGKAPEGCCEAESGYH